MNKIHDFANWLVEGEKGLTPEQVDFLDKYTKGSWTYNKGTGLVDVNGYFDCSSRRLETLQGCRFGAVTGDFICSNNALTSLKGAPQTVSGGFYYHSNKLTTLVGAPQTVDGNFYCYNNELTTLVGAPQTVGGSFLCATNRLTSLKGAPQTVGGDFSCSRNALTTLEGAPQTIEGNISLGGVYDIPDIMIEAGNWNPAGWLEIMTKGTPEARALILTLPQLDTKTIQQEIDQSPEKMTILLAPYLSALRKSHPDLRFPDTYADEMGDLAGLSDLGF